MMAETGSIVKVSGSSSETPLGAPRPGSTPTRMPSSTPAIISRTWYVVSATREAVHQGCDVIHAPRPQNRPSAASSGPLSRRIWNHNSSTT